MENLLYLSVLFEYYGCLLTQRQYDVCDMYYNSNLSLGEISAELGITRQGVRDCLVKSENTLRHYEEKLGIQKKNLQLGRLVNEITEQTKNISDKSAAEIIKKVADKINDLI